MTIAILTGEQPPVLLDPDPPGPEASPQEHANWCAQRGWDCIRQVRLCRRSRLPDGRWLKAARLFRVARQAWRERSREAT